MYFISSMMDGRINHFNMVIILIQGNLGHPCHQKMPSITIYLQHSHNLRPYTPQSDHSIAPSVGLSLLLILASQLHNWLSLTCWWMVATTNRDVPMPKHGRLKYDDQFPITVGHNNDQWKIICSSSAVTYPEETIWNGKRYLFATTTYPRKYLTLWPSEEVLKGGGGGSPLRRSCPPQQQ